MQQEIPSSPKGLTFRSMLLGIAMVLVVCVGSPYSIWIVGSSEPTWSFFPWGVGFPFVLLYFANALCRRLKRSWALRPAEVVTIMTMGLVVSGIPIFMVGWGLAIIASPYYGATPENNWAEYIHPYLPEWAVPQDEGGAMRWFYEGLPSDQGFPFQIWIGPLFWWTSLVLAVYFISFCLVVVFRRQWIEHERLTFPMTELPRLMVEEGDDGSVPLLHSQSFWIGLGLALGIMLFNIISYFHPGFPQLAIHRAMTLHITPDFPPIQLMIYLPVLGFMFLVSTHISFSIWFFYLLSTVQEGIINRIGYDISSPEPFAWGLQTLNWQAWGAFTAMVLWSVWMGRRHLTAVFLHAFKIGERIDDREEMISYRPAVYGTLAGLVYVLWWLCRSGMDFHVALLAVFGVLVAYIGLTRLVIQSGLYYLTIPIPGQAFALAIAGTAIAPTNLVAVSVSYSWFGDVQSIFMPSAAHGARLNELYGRHRRLLGIAMGLAVLIGFVASLYYILYICYQYGSSNLRGAVWQAGGGIAFGGMLYHFDNPASTNWWKLFLFAIGLVVYSVLSFCQYRFSWWPLHPVGLAVSTLWMIRKTVVSVFLAWAIKSVVMYYGGVNGYRRIRPFFLGLIVGYFLGIGTSFTVDWAWFFGKGHPILN